MKHECDLSGIRKCVTSGFSLLLAGMLQAQNPIVQTCYTSDPAPADADKFNKQVHYFFLGCGTEERFGTGKLAESLREMGIHVDYYESQGTAHEWLTWRRCLYRFVPHLFKNGKLGKR